MCVGKGGGSLTVRTADSSNWFQVSCCSGNQHSNLEVNDLSRGGVKPDCRPVMTVPLVNTQ